MDRYEKSAAEIMKRGDRIIAEKKRRAAVIRRTSFAVSGMSATVIVGIGIWNSVPLRNAVDRENPAYSLPEIIPVTSGEPAQTTVDTSRTTVHTTRSGITETVTTAVEAASAQITAVPETQPPIRSTVPPQTSRTMAATDHPGDTVTTDVPGTTVPVPVSTSTVTVTTKKAEYPVTTSAVPATTGELPVTTSEKHNPNSAPISSELVFGDIVYSFTWQNVKEENIGEYLWTTPDKEDIFSIAGVPPEKAVAMREYGSEKYYRYINLDYQAPETDTTGEEKRSDLYDEEETYSYDPRHERYRSDDFLASGKRYLSLGKPEQSGLPRKHIQRKRS